MMFPEEGKYVCRGCKRTMDVGAKPEIITTESKDKEIAIISSDSPATLPKARFRFLFAVQAYRGLLRHKADPFRG